MRAMGRYPWLVSAVLLTAADTALPRPPPPSAFDTPPYSSVVNGTPGGAGKVPAALPRMGPGEAQVFFFCCGATNADTCARESMIRVEAASDTFGLTVDGRKALVQCAVEAITLRLFRGAGGIAVASDAVTIAKHGSSGRVRTVGDTVGLSLMSRTATVATAVSGGLLTANRSTGGHSKVTGAHTARARVDTRESVSLVDAADSSGFDRTDRSGAFGAFNDARSVAMLTDSDFVRMLIDANLIDGFYDAQNILMVPAMEVPPEELAAFQAVVEKGGPMSNLVDRAFSAALRTDEAGAASNCVVELSMLAVGGSSFHHGARVLFTVGLSNRGCGPVYDALILNALPAHTTFVEFPFRDAPRRGFSQTYLAKRELLVWKIYRPLQPGETFRTSYLVTLDPWRVPADWRPARQGP